MYTTACRKCKKNIAPHYRGKCPDCHPANQKPRRVGRAAYANMPFERKLELLVRDAERAVLYYP